MQLSREDIRRIAENMLETVSQRLETIGVTLRVSDAVLDKLAEKGFDPVYGARPLRREIQSVIEDAAAEALLDGTLEKGSAAEASVEDGKIVIRQAE